MKYYVALLAVFLSFVAAPAEARHARHHHPHPVRHHRVHIAAAPAQVWDNSDFMHPHLVAASNPFSGARSLSVTLHRVRAKASRRPSLARETTFYTPTYAPRASYREGTIVSHPVGCPGRAFCGCGAAVRVFGHSVRELWLAAAWFRYPPASPAPGMVAVRRHHVMVLEADLGNGLWQVYDANSGGHATRIHARSLAGYSIRNPHGSRYASAF
jgi:hypothetical protein